VGFRLSLGAVFGITLLVPQLHAAGRGGSGLGKLAAYIRLGMLASFSAQVGALPVLLYHFGRVSLMGVLSNLVVLPLVTLAVASGLEAAVAGFVWERLGLVFMKGASALVAVAIWLASHSTRYVDPVVFAGRPHAIRLLAYVCGLGFIGFLCPRLRRRWKLLALIGLYGFLVTPGLQGRSSGIALTFIHVGDGDACLAELGRGETLLIDAGTGPGDYDAGRLCVLPLLAMKGLKHLDTVILTHSHNDHYGGLASLIGNVDIGRVVIGSQEGEGGYLDVLDRCREKGIPVQGVGRGDTLVCGDAGLEILHPSAAYLGHGTGDPNAQSVVVRLVYGKTMFLFTGDLTPEVQQELVHAGFDLSCDVLKVPHHGAPGGLDRGFLYGCGARYAVISAGSRFASHPCPDVIGLLEGSGARTFVTKRHGAVTISGDGEDLRIRTEVQGRVIPGSLSSSASRLDAAAPRW
jgi:competence protein ComEC